MRVKRGVVRRRKHQRYRKQAKGFKARRKSCYTFVKDAVEKSLQYAYRDRRTKKRDFRKLWIIRINAAAKANGMSYSKFIHGLKQAEIDLDRKTLAELAVSAPSDFAQLVEKAKAAA